MNGFEDMLDRNTPPFVVSVHALQERFHILKWWECPVRHDNGMIVPKPHADICNGYFGKTEAYPHMPSFVLNDGRQMERLEGSVWNAEQGLAYYNPFWRERGWYVVVVDEPTLFPEEVEKDIAKAYGNGGQRVLVLFAQLPFESQLARLLDYADSFHNLHSMGYNDLDHSGRLSDDAIWCLNEPSRYSSIPNREEVLDEIVAKFQSQEPLVDMNSMEEDFEVLGTLGGGDFIHQPCFVGNVMLNNFVRSRMDAYSKTSHHKSLNDMWHDEALMRTVVDYELGVNGVGRYHQGRILANMKFKHSFRTVSNLNQSMVYIHCKPYAKKGGVFFDPCAGWGGRMLGAYMLGMKYVAIDANRALVDELNALAEYMKYDVEIVYGDSSDRDCVMDLMAGRKADLSFTCPPYWNEEHYSDDPFQSDVKCTGKQDWHDSFFKPMVFGMLDATDGNCIISVDEKVDWSRIDGIEAVRSNGSWFNRKREDDYYLVRRK